MKRYLHLFPLMALTAATFTLAACDENKTDDTATTEQTAPAETVASAPETTTTDTTTAAASVMHAEGATSYATMPDATTGVAFLTLHNPQSVSDKLVGASTDVASSVEIHETATDANGTMSMRKVDAIEVQPGQQVDLKPQSYHLMLMGLKTPLQAGREFPLTLDFQNAPDVTIQVMVTSPVSASTPEVNTSPTPAATTEPTTSTPDEPVPAEGTEPEATAPVMPEEPAAPVTAPTTDAAPADDAHSGH